MTDAAVKKSPAQPDDRSVVVHGRRGRSTGYIIAIGCAWTLGGCLNTPTSPTYLQPWDGQAMQWEAPPGRTVIDIDAGGTGSGGPGGTSSGGSGSLAACTKADQGNCCYQEDKGLSGSPRCTWKRLGRGESVSITVVTHKGVKTTPPVPLQLTGAAPDRFASYEDCVNTPIGFVLSGPGLDEEQLGGGVSHFDVKTDGTWQYQGGGGTVGLAAARDTSNSVPPDGGPLTPRYTLGEGLCKPLRDMSGYSAAVAFTDQIDFHIGGEEYSVQLRSNPNGTVTGYYVVVQKGF